MKKILMMMAVATTLFTACKKSDDAPAQLDVTLANIAGVYKITSDVTVEGGVTYDNFNGGTIGGVAYPSDYDACEKDDTYTFAVAGTVTKGEGAVSCSPASSGTVPFTLNTTTKVLTVSAAGISGTVESLTSTAMVLKQTSTVMGMTSVQTITFSK